MSDYRAKFNGLNVKDMNMSDLADAVASAPAHIRDEDYRDDNTARASFAAQALVTFVERAGENEMETNISDLLGDLMHLCDALGIDFDEAVDDGRVYYEAEVEGAL